MSACSFRTAALLFVLGSACSEPEPAAAERPSVILVSIDTLRADHVGLYGYARDTTPFLDRWSKGATVFDQAFTTAAWTLVAHMTMLTGLFPEQHDVIGSKRALSPEIPLVAERLRAAGYRTAGLYFPGWIHERHGFQRGFDLFLPHQDLAEADAHLRELLPQLEEHRPFFLFVHLFDAHCGPFSDTDSAIYPSPEPYEHMFVEPRMKPWPDKPPKEVWWTRGVLGPEDFETATALYDGGIREVDDRLGVWFGELERRGLFENTLTIVTADHGEALGQRGILDMHGEYFQEALHIPLLVRAPDGSAAGRHVSEPVHLGDIVPTILAAAGLPPEPRLPGLSLLGPLPPERLIYGVKLPQAFILNGKEKLVLSAQDVCVRFDLARDPGELAPERVDAQRFEELRSKVMTASGTFPTHIPAGVISAEERQKLEALGYGGEDGVPKEKKEEPKAPPAPPKDAPREGG
jgi:arylsulfatase A-like enzyme